MKREDLFITSKLNNPYHHREHVRPMMEKTLKDLRVEYLDLFLMHWPVAFVYVPYDQDRRGCVSFSSAALLRAASCVCFPLGSTAFDIPNTSLIRCSCHLIEASSFALQCCSIQQLAEYSLVRPHGHPASLMTTTP